MGKGDHAGGNSGGGELTRRTRRKPQFLKYDHTDKPDAAEVPKGTGKELKDIPNVAYRMSKMKQDDMAVTFLHRIIFKRPGKGTTRKRAILSFSGFAFPKASETDEFTKIEEKISQQQVKVLNDIVALFDLPKGLKDKAAKVESIVNFLKCPEVLSDVDASQQVKRKRRASQPKKEPAKKRKAKENPEEEAGGPSKKKTQPKKRAKRSKKADAPEPAENDDDEPMEDSPKDSPESDDPAPKAEENQEDAKPENAEDEDAMDSEEEGENDADKADDKEAGDKKDGKSPEKEEVKKGDGEGRTEACSTDDAVQPEPEANDKVKDD